ncbi:chromate efflux transporter [Lutimonas saemankumensis]|uniref:chromate efflux transporter n=1 Tax=Lutimonas saemankumensis TaxID=483016 RepID=UPI001CD3BCCE|nr:chromate efflux transporter [Lutimonas saemankumensis]MCA0931442.1 chromate efflux transporter [Lutimonas saemankumensis]
MPESKNRLLEVFGLFLKLGCIAFGGPAAHISMMEEEVVTKRKWMSRQYFLDMVGATNLVPGPNSTQMTMHCGHVRAGWKGLWVAGIAFIGPAVFFTLILAIIYGTYGEVPEIAPFFFGIKPAVIGLIVNATFKLGKKAFKNLELIILGVAITVMSLYGLDEFLLIIGSGVIGMLLMGFREPVRFRSVSFPLLIAMKPLVAVITNKSIFLTFLKIAMVLFGSGYVLIAYLDAELVEKLGWLTKDQLLDAIAMGQFTPGPVLTTATFVGYQMNGLSGALWASLGMFLPSFFLVGLLVKLIPYLRKSVLLSKFLDAVNAGAVGIMIAVTLKLGYELAFDWRAAVLMALSILITFFMKKISPLWIILGGGILGYLINLF